MELMIWDDEMEAFTQVWADRCIFEHGDPESSSGYQTFISENTGYIGQNIHSYGVEPEQAIIDFYDEIEFYRFSDWSCVDTWWKCGHYTQVVWAETNSVACARGATCDFMVCNYYPAGNFFDSNRNDQVEQPFESGISCSECPDDMQSCVDGLCATSDDADAASEDNETDEDDEVTDDNTDEEETDATDDEETDATDDEETDGDETDAPVLVNTTPIPGTEQFSTIPPEGSTIPPEGSTVPPEGSTIAPEGSTIPPEGSTVSSEDSVSTTATNTSDEVCDDTDYMCASYDRRYCGPGELYENKYMRGHCRLTCNLCNGVGLCMDFDDWCPYYSTDYCEQDSGYESTYMKEKCPATCSICAPEAPCFDDDPYCSQYDQKYCDTGYGYEYTYMRAHCTANCGLCH